MLIVFTKLATTGQARFWSPFSQQLQNGGCAVTSNLCATAAGLGHLIDKEHPDLLIVDPRSFEPDDDLTTALASCKCVNE